ncbi:MAG: fumarylacetoacetate hydrolase family protein [Methanobacteriaceae archaeon]|nr:fumarylacetoacetate hydrolase family protein [Methanobacteriaceae archaeon]MDP2835985.1 fumarylacetoacetate hydrolase family protein [Methanobacteriaceae archaeon]MDP3035759.1 fumarylacetoacetate hydrolase family protein [Methanobacteriaceae archaeon]MDP3484056.1 fumarylacetoacetate hydrolase family protein [Methanobacteriaceae archaeon]MDP3622809.1 fumarylacetoacetate hydrolase family protein [Methanobacteriaceae archaeon]
MKLLRFIEQDSPSFELKTGILMGNHVVEIGQSIFDLPLSEKYLDKKQEYFLEDIKILPPVSPSKVVAVGLNYRDHAVELNMRIPKEPIIFIKPSTTVIGHEDHIIYPPQSENVNYEAELAIVISKKAEKVSENDALNYVLGYTVLNDVTARDLQEKDGQWTRSKSFNTFCPLGPCIETDVNPNDRNISLRVNGELKQDSNTENLIFSVEKIINFISNIMTLNPGDVIATGTPPGVGSLKVGDTVEVEIEGIGILKNVVSSF